MSCNIRPANCLYWGNAILFLFPLKRYDTPHFLKSFSAISLNIGFAKLLLGISHAALPQ